jgi:hypothetical protein
LLVSAPRHQNGTANSGDALHGATEKVEENSKYPLTSERNSILFTSRSESGVARKTSDWFFQRLGLQIELNLVPTMNGVRFMGFAKAFESPKFNVGIEIEFFVARKSKRRAVRSLKV